jgi:hypothetical protein
VLNQSRIQAKKKAAAAKKAKDPEPPSPKQEPIQDGAGDGMDDLDALLAGESAQQQEEFSTPVVKSESLMSLARWLISVRQGKKGKKKGKKGAAEDDEAPAPIEANEGNGDGMDDFDALLAGKDGGAAAQTADAADDSWFTQEVRLMLMLRSKHH